MYTHVHSPTEKLINIRNIISIDTTVEVNEMKVKVVLNAKNAYCDADKLAEYLYELNYCDVKKLDDERVELSFDSAQLKRIYNEFYTLEYFLRDAIAKCTEASEQFAYMVDLNDIVVSVDIEFKDVYFADEVVDAVVEKV